MNIKGMPNATDLQRIQAHAITALQGFKAITQEDYPGGRLIVFEPGINKQFSIALQIVGCGPQFLTSKVNIPLIEPGALFNTEAEAEAYAERIRDLIEPFFTAGMCITLKGDF